MNTARVTRLVRVTGLVQGVGYRYATMRYARELGVTGWVRNRYDGSVEALVQGTPAGVAALIGWMRRGPAGAAVARVDERDGPDGAVFASFELWPSA
jgi:acylphosphatase